jgi:hypothetical protein
MADWLITHDVSGWYAWGPDGQIRKIDAGWPDIARIIESYGESSVGWGTPSGLLDQFIAEFGEPPAKV